MLELNSDSKNKWKETILNLILVLIHSLNYPNLMWIWWSMTAQTILVIVLQTRQRVFTIWRFDCIKEYANTIPKEVRTSHWAEATHQYLARPVFPRYLYVGKIFMWWPIRVLCLHLFSPGSGLPSLAAVALWLIEV